MQYLERQHLICLQSEGVSEMGNVHKIPLGKEDFGVNLNPPCNV